MPKNSAVESCPKIRECYPVTGDWFIIRHDEFGDNKSYIERVLQWASIDATDAVDHLVAVDTTGMPVEDDGGGIFYVYGPDSSPMGPTWNEVYQKTAPTRVMVREITESFSPLWAE